MVPWCRDFIKSPGRNSIVQHLAAHSARVTVGPLFITRLLVKRQACRQAASSGPFIFISQLARSSACLSVT